MIAFYSMNKFFNYFKSISHFLALPLLSGIMVGTSYIPFNGWALLFCYIPLWYKIIQILKLTETHSKKISQVFWAAWFTQFILTLIGFNWIYYVSVEFGQLPVILALGAQLLFAAFMHLYIPFSLYVAAKVLHRLQIKNTFIILLVLALSMSLTERIWPSIFEWNLGYTLLWIKMPIYQWADTVGFWGLSTWILLIQAVLAYALFTFKENKKQSLTLIVQLAVVIIVLNIVGIFKGQKWSHTDDKVKISVAQGNVGNAEKLQSEKQQQYHAYIVDVYSKLTSEVLQQSPSDLIIWPETAMPMALDKNYLYAKDQRQILQNVQAWGIPLITGGYSYNQKEKNHLGESVIKNSVFYFSPQNDYAAEPYYKTNLLAFGEYLPFGETFPFLYKLLPFVGVYAKGSGPQIATLQLKNKTLKLGPQICYDSLYPDYSRELFKNGAQIIFNVTNDAWFGWWAEPFQHQFMTLARAVEVRLPLVRSTNTGISSAILANGEVLENSPINKAWAHTYEIPYKQNPTKTLYTQFGYFDWVIWLALLITLLMIYRKKGTHV